MSNNSVIVNKYAKTAFKIAKEANLGDVFVKDLGIFCQNVSNFTQELSNPAISKLELGNIIKDLTIKLKINEKLSDFLIIVTTSRRINLINKIFKDLENLVKEDNKILQVELISAKKLKKEQLKAAEKVLADKYPKNKIEFQETVKENILGGIIIKIGSSIIDTSVKTQLQNIYSDCKSIL